MIKELTIQNFQSHKNTKLNFSPGVNVVLGTSDSGKSAFFRALLWLCYSRPLGDQFCSWWGGSTIVKGVFNSNTITRLKNKKENSYTINDNTPLKAIRADVPPEVQNILKIDRKINVQAQADPFFLLSNMDSPGKVAEQFNTIANLDLIDSSRKKINAMEMAESATINKLKSDISELEEDIKKFAWVAEAEIILSKAEQYDKKIKQYNVENNALLNILFDIEAAKKQINKQKPILKLKPMLEQVNDILTEIKRLNKAKADIDDTLLQIKKQKQKLKNKDIIENAQAELTTLNGINDNIRKEGQNKKDLSDIIDSIQNTKKSIGKNKQELKQLKYDFNTNMPDICPLCGK